MRVLAANVRVSAVPRSSSVASRNSRPNRSVRAQRPAAPQPRAAAQAFNKGVFKLRAKAEGAVRPNRLSLALRSSCGGAWHALADGPSYVAGEWRGVWIGLPTPCLLLTGVMGARYLSQVDFDVASVEAAGMSAGVLVRAPPSENSPACCPLEGERARFPPLRRRARFQKRTHTAHIASRNQLPVHSRPDGDFGCTSVPTRCVRDGARDVSTDFLPL